MNKTETLFKSVLGLQHAFFESVRSQMWDVPVHPRQGPILALLLHQQGLSQADLRREMKVSAATVAVSLSRLEKLGYVTRERNQSNQRANVLALTEKGEEAAMRLQEAMQQVRQAALTGFNEEELQKLANFFQRMEHNILALCQRPLGLNSEKEDHGYPASDV